MNGCEEYAEAISALWDGELPEAERAALRQHLETCEGCRQYYADLQRLHEAICDVPAAEITVSRPCRKRTWARYAAVGVCAAVMAIVILPSALHRGTTADQAENGEIYLYTDRQEEEAPAVAEGAAQEYSADCAPTKAKTEAAGAAVAISAHGKADWFETLDGGVRRENGVLFATVERIRSAAEQFGFADWLDATEDMNETDWVRITEETE